MNRTVVGIKPATKERLARLARTLRKPQSQLAETAIEQYLERSEWQLKEIEQGLKEIDEGRVISHEDLLQHWEGKSAGKVD